MTETVVRTGPGRRPGPALTARRRQQIEARSRKVAALEERLEEARDDLNQALAAAVLEDGVAVRTVAEATNVSYAWVHKLAQRGAPTVSPDGAGA